MNIFIDKVHDDDRCGIEGLYEPQGYFTDAKVELIEVGTYMRVFQCLHVASRDKD